MTHPAYKGELEKIIEEQEAKRGNAMQRAMERNRKALLCIQEIVERLGAKPWPKCGRCAEEYLMLRPSGMCGNCDPPPEPVRKIKTHVQVERDLASIIAGDDDE
jgi:hypothetical protein